MLGTGAAVTVVCWWTVVSTLSLDSNCEWMIKYSEGTYELVVFLLGLFYDYFFLAMRF